MDNQSIGYVSLTRIFAGDYGFRPRVGVRFWVRSERYAPLAGGNEGGGRVPFPPPNSPMNGLAVVRFSAKGNLPSSTPDFLVENSNLTKFQKNPISKNFSIQSHKPKTFKKWNG
jgi:hypothetical protein